MIALTAFRLKSELWSQKHLLPQQNPGEEDGFYPTYLVMNLFDRLLFVPNNYLLMSVKISQK